MDIGSVDQGVRVQVNLLRKTLDLQTENAQKLVKGSSEEASEPAGSRDDALGNMVDERA